MRRRLVLLAFLACLPGRAELQLSRDLTGAVCNNGSSVCSKDVVIELGSVGVTGTTVAFRVTNTGAKTVTIQKFEIEGPYFSLADAPETGVALGVEAFVTFGIRLTPDSVGRYQAWLSINDDRYRIAADVKAGGGNTEQPGFRIVVEPETLASGQQARLALKFDAPAAAAGSGNVRLDFTGPGDPAIAFISPAARAVAFHIEEGQDTATFSGEPYIEFQSGTTAGTITLTATLDPDTEREQVQTATIPLAAARAALDPIRSARASGEITISVPGYDNTRTASAVSFTFFDSSHNVLGSGAIAANVAQPFADYFANPPAGGMFVLRARFPVAGDATVIDSVEVSLTNSAGSASASAKIAE